MEAMTHTGFTMSWPGWVSIFMGVNPRKHGIIDNGMDSWKDEDYKSFLWHGRMENGFKTLFSSNFDEATTYIMIESDAADIWGFWIEDEDMTVLLEKELAEGDSQKIYFLVLNDADKWGGKTGQEKENPIYINHI